MMLKDPELALHRLEMERLPIDLKADVQVTFLFIQTRDSPYFDRIHRDLLRMEMRTRSRRMPYVRIRIWDRQQLVRLIQDHPQLWQKYFTADGRIRSTTRKSYEALYIEVSELNDKLQATVRALEEEREKRARAERDAVWKDVAFTAAHKLGNPIFALETSLQAIKRRLSRRPSELCEIVGEMESSIEKAKLIIDQFKSLTRANEIEPRAVDLVPLLRGASRVVVENGVDVQISSENPDVRALADPTRIAECFDELFANALHWVDGDGKKICATLDTPDRTGLPSALKGKGNYVRVRITDNGCGIPADNKEKVFAPFFTTYPHGTGLGLALVQRVVEGHGGLIRETGEPKNGATFEIFLPRAP
jgi:signal transduction histidine kinase